MAEYDIHQSEEDELTLTVDKQNLYLVSGITGVEKTQRPSDNTPEYEFTGYNGRFKLVRTAKDLSTFTTPYILILEGGPATAEIGVPEDFAIKIVNKITEMGWV